jgi:hypothetical protein
MKSKLGFHNNGHPPAGMLDKLMACQPVAVKTTNDIARVNEWAEALPNTMILFRITTHDTQYMRDIQSVAGSGLSIENQYHIVQELAYSWLELHPLHAVPKRVYWEGQNEPDTSSPDVLALYGVFESTRARMLHDRGHRACVGNFSVGTPKLADWQYLTPIFKACDEVGAVLGLHEYGGCGIDYGFDETTQEGWFFGRFNKVYTQWIKDRYPNVKIVLTELGISDTVGDLTTRGYLTCGQSEQWAIDQYIKADTIMQSNPAVIGSCIFNWGDLVGGWKSFEIEGNVADGLCRYVGSTFADDYPTVSRQARLRDNPTVIALSSTVIKPGDEITIMGEYYNTEERRVYSYIQRGDDEGWILESYIIND